VDRHIAGVLSLFEGARDGGVGALEYADDTDIGFLIRRIRGALLAAFASEGAALIFDLAGQHGIAVHRDTRVFRFDRVAVTTGVGVWYEYGGTALTKD